MKITIVRSDDIFTSQELKERLEGLPDWDSSITLEIRQEQHLLLKTVDPTVLAAIFAMTGTALGALITGLLQVVRDKHKEKIVLVTKDGLRIEVEARHAQDKIPELIKLLRSMEVQTIRI
jgi:hypothetical protein